MRHTPARHVTSRPVTMGICAYRSLRKQIDTYLKPMAAYPNNPASRCLLLLCARTGPCKRPSAFRCSAVHQHYVGCCPAVLDCAVQGIGCSKLLSLIQEYEAPHVVRAVTACVLGPRACAELNRRLVTRTALPHTADSPHGIKDNQHRVQMRQEPLPQRHCHEISR